MGKKIQLFCKGCLYSKINTPYLYYFLHKVFTRFRGLVIIKSQNLTTGKFFVDLNYFE